MRLSIDTRIKNHFNVEFEENETLLLKETSKQLDAYFNKFSTSFDLPIELIGTEFQKKVWKALQNIPYGMTKSYLQLSHIIENPKAIRAVASANGANALSIIIPCHRIIGSQGELTGYAGGLNAKKKLLLLENSKLIQAELF